MSSGLLLAFPLESVAVRLALALGLALVLLRIVSRWNLRSPRARTVLAGSPFVVAAAVVILSSRDLGLPSLLAPSVGPGGSLALPVADRYLDFAPMAPVIVGLWAGVSLARIVRRLVRATRLRRRMVEQAQPAEPRIAAIAVRLARDLGVTPPRVLVARGATGGAAVIGVRDPIMLLDEEILHRLDEQELEGVIAHELAHVARHDNLVAWAVAMVRDVAFFVPGSGWAVSALHREREAAADQRAVAATKRPAALASGLLTVVELTSGTRRVEYGCAALVSSSSVVDRVQLLLDDRPASPREHRAELLLAAAVSLVAVVAAVLVPGSLTGAQGEREALGVLVGARAPTSDASGAQGSEARVFTVYRQLGPEAAAVDPAVSAKVRGGDLFGVEDRAGVALACMLVAEGCPEVGRSTGLVLQPQPIVLLEDRMSARWQATPVGDGAPGERVGLYWLARLVDSQTRGS